MPQAMTAETTITSYDNNTSKVTLNKPQPPTLCAAEAIFRIHAGDDATRVTAKVC
jgi:hypothetical protein